jgi:hypothetical protein
MGEAKRRKEQDPNYGKKRQAPPTAKNKGFSLSNFDIRKISKTELIVWAVFFAIAVGTFVWTGTLQ